MRNLLSLKLLVVSLGLMLLCMMLCPVWVEAAVVKGTSCGFVTVAPTSDPEGYSFAVSTWGRGFKDVAPTGATKVTEIGVYINIETEAADIDLGIYSHNAGDDNPEALLGSATIPKGTTAGWKTTAVNIDITASTTYWIAVQVDETTLSTSTDYTTDAGEKMDYKATQTSLTDPWGVSGGSGGFLFAVYAVYTTDGAPAAKQVMMIGARDEENYHNPRLGIPPVIWE